MAHRDTLIDVFVTAGSGGLHSPVDLEFGPDGNLYVTSGGTLADPENNAILRYDGRDGHFMDVFAAGLQGAISFGFGDDGDLYVDNRDTNQVMRFDGQTGTIYSACSSTLRPASLAICGSRCSVTTSQAMECETCTSSATRPGKYFGMTDLMDRLWTSMHN